MCFAGNLYAEWTELNPGVTHDLYDCCFLTPELGFFTGYENDADPIVLKTSTGGCFWGQTVPYPNMALYSIFFVDNDTGFVVGHDDSNGFGCIIRTSDSGLQWNNVVWQMGCTTIYDLDFPSHDVGYTSGDNGYVFRTPNTGTTWFSRELDGYPQVKFIDFVNENSGFVIAEDESKVYKTNDAGDSWNPIYTYDDLNVGGIHFFDESNGIFVGRTLNSYAEVIYRTTNGCSTFTQVFSGIDNSSLNDVHFYGSRGWAVGDGGRIIRTNNGGASWFLETVLDPPVNLHCVFDTGESIYVAGEQGKVFKKDEYYSAEPEPEEPEQYFTSHPNPFSTSTIIKLSQTTRLLSDTPRQANLHELSQIKIYNIKGQLVRTITLTSFLSPSLGTQDLTWDGKDENGNDVKSGVYFYQLSGNDEHIGKVVKLK